MKLRYSVLVTALCISSVQANNLVIIGACSEASTLISVIQGTGSASVLAGETLVVEGVVTATTPNLSGFFVQEETADIRYG
jgi:predicted extracellular nuclease